ncbi:RING finger domain-containing protein [Neoconidiobolus thromboides FSU 785]|nr:RING finger domain-containing protein [Neoconidiobolus thromboides FSU 785]
MDSFSDNDGEFYEENSDIEYDSDSGMVDEIGDSFEPLEKEKKKKKMYECEFKMFTPEELREYQDKEITAINDIFGLDKALIGILLRKYRWNRDKLTELLSDDPDNTYKKSGIDIILDKGDFEPEIKEETDFFCNICCNDSPNQKVVKFYCGVDVCFDCHKTYLEQKIYDGGSRAIVCLTNCGVPYKDDTIKNIVSTFNYEKYLECNDKIFVQDKSYFKWCPLPECKNAVYCEVPPSSLTTFVPSVKCQSDHSFCFGCLRQDHSPCLCFYADLWIKKCEDDSETANWLNANTKECPKCGSTIEKNGGCNHMTCRKCTNEFCWVCMGSWAQHGQAWYNCTRYDEKEGADARNKQEESRRNLKRYLHYYNRYMNHLQSSKLDQDLYARTENNMELMQKESELSWIEVQFLKSAVDTLVECRHTLMWSYAFAYYLARDNSAYLFENNQQDLELNTEALSGLLEEPIEKDTISILKQKVLDKAFYVSQRRDILLEDVMKGFQEDRWAYNTDMKKPF